MGRPPCCDKLDVKRGLWTAEEDAKILAYVSKYGTGNWTALPKKAGLRRCGKSCRLRWTNYLRPDLKHDGFTPQEEELIVRLHAAIGSRWSIIAQQLPGRTDNDVKNYWNTKLKKKLSEKGIDPVTHKPFSQILADYGNIGCLPKYGTRIGCLTRDLTNAFISKPEPCLSPPQGISSFINTHLLPAKLEPMQECFLNNKNINSTTDANSNHSLDLLDQLQAIKLVAEASSSCINYDTISPHFLNEASSSSSSSSSSSCSSSSSTCSTAGQEKSALNFSWRDFLIEDVFLRSDHPLEQENAMELSSKVFASEVQNLISKGENNTREHVGVEGKMNLAIPSCTSYQDPCSSSHTSFVEAMLDQENEENFLNFPIPLLEEPFSY